jgi:2-amino-4-hydroxy-6-hydroxymethyldihydropteridine diphosphokinase
VEVRQAVSYQEVEREEGPLDHERLAYIGLGANLGRREASLARAIEHLARAGLPPVLRSSLYRTEPVEVVDQEEFLNQVVACATERPPEDLLAICLAIELEMGRVRTRDRGPRVIDLDLLLAGSEVRNRQDLVLPHPRLHLRRFVLVPLAEIAPAARHPILGLTAAEMLDRCPDRARVERLL